MEKSSSNIKKFWSFLSRGGGKSYTLPRDNHHVENGDAKFGNGSISNNVANCSAENIYSMRYHHKSKTDDDDNECDRKRVRNLLSEKIAKCQRIYNSSFCLPIFTPISCR